MKRTRVLYKDNFYYPQYRFCFIWCTWGELVVASDQYDEPYTRTIRFRTREEAVQFIQMRNSLFANKPKKVKKVVWTSEKEYEVSRTLWF